MSGRFEDYAKIRIGFKSLLNDFFYVDQETIKRFGIEAEFLQPILKLADLNGDSFYQNTKASQRWLFTCRKDKGDLRGTGALQYILWGEKQETRPRKQSQERVPWPQAPALSHSKLWYSPAAKVHLTKIAIRKAAGQRYAPFLFRRPTLVDQRLYIILPKKDVNNDLLAAYLSSSFFPLSLETNANLSLGVGYLTLGTMALRRLPTVDLKALSGSPDLQSILDAADEVHRKAPIDAEHFPVSAELRALDEAVLAALKIDVKRAQQLEDQVAHFAAVRKRLQELKKSTAKASHTQDVAAVANSIASDLEKWLSTRRFPEDYADGSTKLYQFPTDRELSITADPFFDRCKLTVTDENGEKSLDTEMSLSVATVLVRALQLGRRNFKSPHDDSEANKALAALAEIVEEFETLLESALSESGIGTKYFERVKSRVLKSVGINLPGLLLPLEKETVAY